MNKYKLTFVSYGVFQRMKEAHEPFGLKELEECALRFNQIFTEVVNASSAEDAITMIRINKGFCGIKSPYVTRIEAIEDCVSCGKPATTWRKGNPVCDSGECADRQ